MVLWLVIVSWAWSAIADANNTNNTCFSKALKSKVLPLSGVSIKLVVQESNVIQVANIITSTILSELFHVSVTKVSKTSPDQVLEDAYDLGVHPQGIIDLGFEGPFPVGPLTEQALRTGWFAPKNRVDELGLLLTFLPAYVEAKQLALLPPVGTATALLGTSLSTNTSRCGNSSTLCREVYVLTRGDDDSNAESAQVIVDGLNLNFSLVSVQAKDLVKVLRALNTTGSSFLVFGSDPSLEFVLLNWTFCAVNAPSITCQGTETGQSYRPIKVAGKARALNQFFKNFKLRTQDINDLFEASLAAFALEPNKSWSAGNITDVLGQVSCKWLLRHELDVMNWLGIPNATRTITLKMGVALPETGLYAEMRSARLGYQFFEDHINKQGGFQVGMNTRVLIKLTVLEVPSTNSSAVHKTSVQRLLKEVDVLLGSHPAFAKQETVLAEQANVLNVQCCVGPDSIYQQGFANVFGVQASNTKYALPFIRSIATRGSSKLFVIFQTDNIFTNTTCEAGIAMARDMGMKVKSHFFAATDMRSAETYAALIQDMSAGEYRDVVACVFIDDGLLLAKAAADAIYLLDNFFVTTGPWFKENFRDKLADPIGLVSAGQWNMDVNRACDMFGNVTNYNKLYTEFAGDQPDYIAAGATAAAMVTMYAIQETYYKTVVPSRLEFGTIKNFMRRINVQTFFGDIRFDGNQRNIALDPVTIQVFPLNPDYPATPPGKGPSVIKTVLPVDVASAEFVGPLPFSTKVGSHPLGYILLVLSVVAIIYNGVLAVMIINYRDTKVMRRASLPFLLLSLVGCIAFAVYTSLTLATATDFICRARFVILDAAFVLMFGPLAAKEYRVYRIFSVKQAHESVYDNMAIKNSDLFLQVAALGAVQCIFTITSLVETTTVAYRSQCLVRMNSALVFVEIAFRVIITGACGYSAFKTRSLSLDFVDSKNLGMAVYNVNLLQLVWIAVYFLSNEYLLQTFVMGFCTLAVSVTTSTLVHLPKVLTAKQPETKSGSWETSSISRDRVSSNKDKRNHAKTASKEVMKSIASGPKSGTNRYAQREDKRKNKDPQKDKEKFSVEQQDNTHTLNDKFSTSGLMMELVADNRANVVNADNKANVVNNPVDPNTLVQRTAKPPFQQ